MPELLSVNVAALEMAVPPPEPSVPVRLSVPAPTVVAPV